MAGDGGKDILSSKLKIQLVGTAHLHGLSRTNTRMAHVSFC